MPVANKIAIVTGGASGIGRASALLLARNGAKIVVADRDAAGAKAVCREIEAAGGTARDFTYDNANSKDVDRLAEYSMSEFGRVDILLHSAGICPRQPLFEMSDEDWRNVLAVNLDGTFFATRAVGRIMIEQKSGTMILLTSDRGLHGSVDCAHYAASKGGMIALAKSLAIALGKHGVTVNGLNPGMTDTPLGRGAQTEDTWQAKSGYDALGTYSLPEEIAEIVLFLAGNAGRFMTGQIVSTRMRLTF
jgi:NAD(P)-dependent dehydrogenase (short-subunit alcohol dehydrogenase family)